jgi:hypothetical protein
MLSKVEMPFYKLEFENILQTTRKFTRIFRLTFPDYSYPPTSGL